MSIDLRIRFSTDNAAFSHLDDPEEALPGVLRDIANKIENYDEYYYIKDANGNTIGKAELYNKE